jgi:hypothetical protein
MSSTPPSRSKLPPNAEVTGIGKRSADLALFWSRSPRDALATLSGLVLLRRPVTVRLVDEAVALLRAFDSEGARRLADRLESRTLDRTDEAPPWYIVALPERVVRRQSGKRYPCAYLIEPTTKLQCHNEGQFVVPGARGTFCALHAHRTVSRIERKVRRTARRRGTPQT